MGKITKNSKRKACLRRQAQSAKLLGFTLIEVLTVSGIMALFSLTLTSVFLSTFRGGNKAQLTQQLHQNGDFALSTMAREIRGANKANCGSSLTLTKTDGETISFSLETVDGIDKIASNSGEWLTGIVGSVSNLSFICYEGTMGNQIITIDFTLSAGQTANAQAQEKLIQNFATSVATRQH